MLDRLRPRLTFANVMSVIAVFVALGGASYAITTAPKDSVTAKSIKKDAVRGAEIKANAVGGDEIGPGQVGSGEVADDSLGSEDVTDGALGGADIFDGAIGSEDVADGSLGPVDIADNSLGPDDVADNSLGPGDIADNSLQTGEIQNGSLVEGDFAEGELGPEAYARVQPNGGLLPRNNGDVPNTSKGLDGSDVTHNAPGVYCFGDLGFDLASAMVSSDNANASAANQNNFIVSVAVERGNNLSGCTGAQARVVTTQVNDTVAPANLDHGFTIWFEEAEPQPLGPQPPIVIPPPED